MFFLCFSRQAAVLDSDEEDSAEVLATTPNLLHSNPKMMSHNSSFSDSSSFFSSLSKSKLSGSRISLFKEDDDLPEAEAEERSGGPAMTPEKGNELPPLPGFKARLVEGILRSDFVAKMAESEWVKKNITSKNITLQLQLHSIRGTLCVNFPPAPSDRIWLVLIAIHR